MAKNGDEMSNERPGLESTMAEILTVVKEIQVVMNAIAEAEAVPVKPGKCLPVVTIPEHRSTDAVPKKSMAEKIAAMRQ